MVYSAVVKTPVGPVRVESEQGAIVGVSFVEKAPLGKMPSEVLKAASTQLEEYFSGERVVFNLPLLRPAATPFQHRVWDEMEKIPAGEVSTYGEVAKALGSSPRAVGQACGKNPIPIFIPCHRVVAANGLGGYSGDWETGRAASVKAVLLKHEKDLAKR